jgi:alpha-galactosidase
MTEFRVTEFELVDELAVDTRAGRVYEHGWQSWSPATSYPVDATSYRPGRPEIATMCYRPGRPGPERGFQGEGLLAVDPGDGEPVRVYGATGPDQVPSIRAGYAAGRLTVSAEGPVSAAELPGPLPAALGGWADRFVAGLPDHPAGLRQAPTGWCSWYRYGPEVTEADVVENLTAIGTAELPVDVVQLDDGWQAEIGDWLAYSDRFAALDGLAARIRDTGRRAGIWLAPFLVGARSRTAAEHPDWLVGGADAGHNWGQQLYALDVTHPGAADHLRAVFGRLAGIGFDYYKLDFLYAGALDGPRADGSAALPAYRAGLRLIRDALGPRPYLVGCGAPLLPSVGLVDAMRVSADIAPEFEPDGGDPSRPSQFGATLSAVGRAFQHGRFWVNDPDCLLARAGMRGRAEWAATVERYGGLRCSSDRIAELDDWGLSTTRRVLSEVPPATPFQLDPSSAIIQ